MARRLFQRLVCDERPTAGGGSQSAPSRSTSESHRATAPVDARSSRVSDFGDAHGHPLARLLRWFFERRRADVLAGAPGAPIGRSWCGWIERAGVGACPRRCRSRCAPTGERRPAARSAPPVAAVAHVPPVGRAEIDAVNVRHRRRTVALGPVVTEATRCQRFQRALCWGASRREVVERGERPAPGFVGTSATRASRLPLLES